MLGSGMFCYSMLEHRICIVNGYMNWSSSCNEQLSAYHTTLEVTHITSQHLQNHIPWKKLKATWILDSLYKYIPFKPSSTTEMPHMNIFRHQQKGEIAIHP